jgi:hypothetical protein
MVMDPKSNRIRSKAIRAAFASAASISPIPGNDERPNARYFREELDAGKLPARICEDETEWPSDSTTIHLDEQAPPLPHISTIAQGDGAQPSAAT